MASSDESVVLPAGAASAIVHAACDWTKVHKVTKSAAGSGGVMFAHFLDGSVRVIKSNAGVAQEYYALCVARELASVTEPRAAALRVPDMRLTCWQDPREPYGDECWRIHKACMRHSPVSEHIAVERQLNRPVLMIMEFVRGRDMGDLVPAELTSHISQPLNAFRLGQIIVLDALLHNSDRMPCGLFSNEGNAGNVMMPNGGGGGLLSPVPIDNAIVSLPPSTPMAAKYVAQCEALLHEWLAWARAMSGDNVETDIARASLRLWEVARVDAALATAAAARKSHSPNTLADLHMFFLQWSPDAGLPRVATLPLVCGLLHTVLATAALDPVALGTMHAQCIGHVRVSWDDIWRKNCANLHLDFLLNIRAAFARIASDVRAALDASATLRAVTRECVSLACAEHDEFVLSSPPPAPMLELNASASVLPCSSGDSVSAFEVGALRTKSMAIGLIVDNGDIDVENEIVAASPASAAASATDSALPSSMAVLGPSTSSTSSDDVASRRHLADLVASWPLIPGAAAQIADVRCVLMCQTRPRRCADAAKWLRAVLRACAVRPSLVVLPEDFCSQAPAASMTVDGNSFLSALAAIACEFGVHICIGTMSEQGASEESAVSSAAAAADRPPPRALYTSSALIDECGCVVLTYRKQRTTNNHTAAGTLPGCVDCCADLGRIALLICLDADHADVVATTLAHRPRIIANPCFIATPHMNQQQPRGAPTPSWRVAMQSKAYQLEHVAVRSQVDFVRVDAAQEAGASGLSTLITADCTRYVSPTPGEHCTLVALQPAPPLPDRLKDIDDATAASLACSSPSASLLTPQTSAAVARARPNSFQARMRAPDGVRQRVEDNVGARYHQLSVPVTVPAERVGGSGSDSGLCGCIGGAGSGYGGGADSAIGDERYRVVAWAALDDAAVWLVRGVSSRALALCKWEKRTMNATSAFVLPIVGVDHGDANVCAFVDENETLVNGNCHVAWLDARLGIVCVSDGARHCWALNTSSWPPVCASLRLPLSLPSSSSFSSTSQNANSVVAGSSGNDNGAHILLALRDNALPVDAADVAHTHAATTGAAASLGGSTTAHSVLAVARHGGTCFVIDVVNDTATGGGSVRICVRICLNGVGAVLRAAEYDHSRHSATASAPSPVATQALSDSSLLASRPPRIVHASVEHTSAHNALVLLSDGGGVVMLALPIHAASCRVDVSTEVAMFNAAELPMFKANAFTICPSTASSASHHHRNSNASMAPRLTCAAYCAAQEALAIGTAQGTLHLVHARTHRAHTHAAAWSRVAWRAHGAGPWWPPQHTSLSSATESAQDVAAAALLSDARGSGDNDADALSSCIRSLHWVLPRGSAVRGAHPCVLSASGDGTVKLTRVAFAATDAMPNDSISSSMLTTSPPACDALHTFLPHAARPVCALQFGGGTERAFWTLSVRGGDRGGSASQSPVAAGGASTWELMQTAFAYNQNPSALGELLPPPQDEMSLWQ